MERTHTTVTHWGTFEVESDGRQITGVRPFAKDPDPSPIGASLEAITKNRVLHPSIRRSWLERGPGTDTQLRGVEPFVEVDWDTALDLAAAELDRVRRVYGNSAIFGGSYGWASAGRFHHAQSQLHRFLTGIGGYTSKRNTYSHAAGEVILPHVLGSTFREIQAAHTSWPVMARHTDLIVAFGGIPHKNAQVQHGGVGRHQLRHWLERCRDRGARFVNVSPIRDDLLEEVGAEWLAPRPGTDVAIMLALMHTMVADGRADEAFLNRHCEGWDQLRAYLLGAVDGIAKTAEWAGGITELDPDRIRALAHELATSRSMVNVSWSLQRADYGEQSWWALIALACVIGQIGLPGGGFGLGYGAVASVGNGATRWPLPSFPPGDANPIETFIPVARIADMLLWPGQTFSYDGTDYVYPRIELIYWAGGNPFHHHQDLNRLVRAWQRPATIIVNEPFWTATARRADIVFPATTPLERCDLGGTPFEDFVFSMSAAIAPVGEARDDYAIFTDLARRLGTSAAFTEKRSAEEWVRHLYSQLRQTLPAYPPYDEFVRAGFVQHPEETGADLVLLDRFRADPVANPLPTPSGRIELYSSAIAAFAYPDCPPHPTWLEPVEWLGGAGEYPLHLISNQPSTRLHSQLDHGSESRRRKLGGREILRIATVDAAARGIREGDVVRVFNDRGACLAAAEITDRVRPGVVELPTGAWFDPADPGDPGSVCRHGNPNVLTRDAPTSRLAQGPVAQSCLVEVRREADAPAPRPFEPPVLTRR